MGYRDDFYIVENIIGYSGDLNFHPTVYFQVGKTWGRITQMHDSFDNVGREMVRYDPTYRCGNAIYKGKKCFIETNKYGVIHHSRSVLVRVNMQDAAMATLRHAIFRFPQLKAKSGAAPLVETPGVDEVALFLSIQAVQQARIELTDEFTDRGGGGAAAGG